MPQYWWEKTSPSELAESYHRDVEDAKEFALHGLHKEAAMLYDCAATQRIKQAKLNYGAGLDPGHFKAWENCKAKSAKHEWLAKSKK